jgi:hypothetical protein
MAATGNLLRSSYRRIRWTAVAPAVAVILAGTLSGVVHAQHEHRVGTIPIADARKCAIPESLPQATRKRWAEEKEKLVKASKVLRDRINEKLSERCKGVEANSKQAAQCEIRLRKLLEAPEVGDLNGQIERFCNRMKMAGACYSKGWTMEEGPKKEQYECQPLTCQRCYGALVSDVRHGLTIGPTLRISSYVFGATRDYDACKKKVTGECPLEDNLVLFLTNANCDQQPDETAARRCYAPFVGR